MALLSLDGSELSFINLFTSQVEIRSIRFHVQNENFYF